MNCLILEDEPLAVKILQDYLVHAPQLNLRAVCANGLDALHVLANEKMDVLFVDVNMPKMNGIEFIKSLKGDYYTILTTAYDDFALEGYKLNVVDYLLKPIELERFLQAIEKVMKLHALKKQYAESIVNEPAFLFFNVDKRQVKIYLKDIVYIESLKDYVRIHLLDSSIVTKYQIGSLYNVLGKDQFVRIHKSYLVSMDKIQSVSAAQILVGSTRLPVGRIYKKELDRCFSKLANGLI
jgi:DNA-binding LytR/AlgR family response regulator